MTEMLKILWSATLWYMLSGQNVLGQPLVLHLWSPG